MENLNGGFWQMFFSPFPKVEREGESMAFDPTKLGLAVSSPPTQGELEAVIAKLNELIAALLGISSAT